MESQIQLLQRLQREIDDKKRFERSNYNLMPLSALERVWNISPPEIQEFLFAGKLFVINDPAGIPFFPSFFAETEKYRPEDLMQIIETLHDVPRGLKYHFFTAQLPLLNNRTALQALENGDIDAVLVAATAFAGPKIM